MCLRPDQTHFLARTSLREIAGDSVGSCSCHSPDGAVQRIYVDSPPQGCRHRLLWKRHRMRCPGRGCPRRTWVLSDHRIAAKHCLLTTGASAPPCGTTPPPWPKWSTETWCDGRWIYPGPSGRPAVPAGTVDTCRTPASSRIPLAELTRQANRQRRTSSRAHRPPAASVLTRRARGAQ